LQKPIPLQKALSARGS